MTVRSFGTNTLKWLPLSVVCALVSLRAPVLWTDWAVAHSAGEQVLSHDVLTVYADQPLAQMGPLALLFAGLLPKPAFILFASLLLAMFLNMCEHLVPAEQQTVPLRVCVAIGGGLLVFPWADFANQGHLDDILVLFGCAWLLRALGVRSPRQAGLAFALAVAGKPTAVLAFPLLLPAGGVAIAIAVTATAAMWLPFFIADPVGFLHAGKGVIEVRTGSFPAFLGYDLGGPTPAWVRVLALGGGALACYVFVRRGEHARGLVSAFALRAVVDPNPAQCYAASLIAVGLLADIPRRNVPWTAAMGMAGWLVSWPVILMPALGWPRLLVTALSVAIAPRAAARGRRGSIGQGSAGQLPGVEELPGGGREDGPVADVDRGAHSPRDPVELPSPSGSGSHGRT